MPSRNVRDSMLRLGCVGPIFPVAPIIPIFMRLFFEKSIWRFLSNLRQSQTVRKLAVMTKAMRKRPRPSVLGCAGQVTAGRGIPIAVGRALRARRLDRHGLHRASVCKPIGTKVEPGASISREPLKRHDGFSLGDSRF